VPITYNPDTNTITVVGFSEEEPCTFEDIYNASVANNWGVVDKLDASTYIFRAKLQIGDGSTWTYFADKEKTVIFTSDVTLDYHEAVILVKRHAYLWLGECDEETRTGCKGVTLIVRDVVFNAYAFVIHNEPEGEIRLGGTELIGKRSDLGHMLWLEDDSVNKIWSCRIVGGLGAVKMTNNLDVNELVIQNAGHGWMYGTTPEHPITNVIVECCSDGAYIYSTNPLYLSNARFMRNYYTINTIDLASAPRFTDCEADRWRINWGGTPTEDARIERAYTFKVRVTDKDGNPIENALVELYDKNGNLVFAELTGPDGEISEHSIVSITYTPTETIDNNPYTVKISKEGFTPLEAIVTIDRPMKNLVWPLDALKHTLDEIYDALTAHDADVKAELDDLERGRKVLTNRWKIENNQLVIYDDDGVTPLLRFNLKDKYGNPSEVNVYEREPVE